MKPRWAILGTGGISRTTVGDLHRTENLELVAVASRTSQNASEFAAEYGVSRWYGDYEDAFAAADIDVLYIGTPIGTHADLARRALIAGKHVIVEKAFTTTAAEARALAATAVQHDRFLMEAMWMRFSPAFRWTLDEVAAGAIGEARIVQAAFGFPAPPHWNNWRPQLGGGALLDMGVYPVTLAHAVLGVPDAVEATGSLRADGLDVTASAFLRYSDERFAQVVTSLAGLVGAGATIGGATGLLVFDQPFFAARSVRVETPPLASPRTISFELEGNGYVPMFRAASQAIVDGLREHPRCPLADTIAVLETMDEIRRQLITRGDSRSAH